MVCKKAKDLLAKKEKLFQIERTKKEKRETNEKIVRDYLEKNICPDCGSTNIKKTLFESVPSVMGIDCSCIRYLLTCEQCKCHVTTSGTHICDNRRSVNKYLLRKNPKKIGFFSSLFGRRDLETIKSPPYRRVEGKV